MRADGLVVASAGAALALVLGLSTGPLRRRVRSGHAGRRGLLALATGHAAVACAVLALLSLLYADPGIDARVLGSASLVLLLAGYGLAPRSDDN